MTIKLKSGRFIGDKHPPYIVAEVGSNWTTLEDCLSSISLAKNCGADAVKFQLFTAEALFGVCPEDELRRSMVSQGCKGYLQVSPHPIRDASLPVEWLPRLKEKADKVGIDFMCTAFSPELIDVVDPYVEIHKVASAELTHVRMLERLREIGKPVILSTGASGNVDIGMAVQVLGNTPTVLMYCVAAYPARAVDLYQIHHLRGQFGLPVGYSDHTTDVETIPPLAQSHGAVVIEKHVTFIDAKTPDSPHSLNTDEFKRMVYSLRNKKYHPIVMPNLYMKPRGPTKEEEPMVIRHNRRIIATKDLNFGDHLVEGENFGIYRSMKDDTHAFSPWMIDEINGKTVLKAVRAGDGIGPGDV